MNTLIDTMPEHVKDRIANLTRQKIDLEDRLEYTQGFTARSILENELMEVIHSIMLLTQPYNSKK